MAYPASLTVRTVKGHFVTYPGVGAEGTVRIFLVDSMQGPADDMFVASFGISMKLVNGQFSIDLPATDDPQWTASRYVVDIIVNGKTIRREFSVPSAGSGPLDLTDLIQLPIHPAVDAYILAAAKGAPGGVATLDNDGKITPTQLPALTADSISWANVTDKPSTFPATPQTVTWAQIQNKPSTFPFEPQVISWEDVQNKPALFPAVPQDVSWTEVLGKPSTYPPSTHGHAQTEVTGLVAALSGKAASTHSHAVDWTDVQNKPSTFPSSGGPLVNFGYRDTGNFVFAASTPWVVASGFSVSIPAVAGNKVEVSFSGLYDRGTTRNFAEIVLLVSGAIARYSSTGKSTPTTVNEGDPAIYWEDNRRFINVNNWSFGLALTADLIVGGVVTFGIAVRGAGASTLYANDNYPLRWRIRNDGSN